MKLINVTRRLGYKGPAKRIDHSRMYICTMFGLFFMSLSLLVIGSIPGSVLAELNKWTQTMLSVCVLIGSAICIFGIIRGTRFYKPNGDLRVSYSIGQYGIISICFSMFIYVGAVV